MSELSPAAQAVMDTMHRSYDHEPTRRALAAGVLRAAADQVICSVPPPCADVDEFAKGFLAAHVKYRREILAIAAELEGQPLPQPPTQPTTDPC